MSYLAQFASLLCAGTMMVTSSLQTIAPQRDIDGSLFLVNRTYRISEDYVPQVVQADVSGSLRSMRPGGRRRPGGDVCRLPRKRRA